MSKRPTRGRPKNDPGVAFAGRAMRVVMCARGLTGIDLAALVGVSRSTISCWITGLSMPNSNQVAALIDALECSADDLGEVEVAGRTVKTKHDRA